MNTEELRKSYKEYSKLIPQTRKEEWLLVKKHLTTLNLTPKQWVNKIKEFVHTCYIEQKLDDFVNQRKDIMESYQVSSRDLAKSPHSNKYDHYKSLIKGYSETLSFKRKCHLIDMQRRKEALEVAEYDDHQLR